VDTKVSEVYCPLTSELALAESETPVGALQAFAAVLNVLQADVLVVFQACVALLIEAVNADHAAFTPTFTSAEVAPVYACARAVARAAYAACTAC
jgi:adenylate kinase